MDPTFADGRASEAEGASDLESRTATIPFSSAGDTARVSTIQTQTQTQTQTPPSTKKSRVLTSTALEARRVHDEPTRDERAAEFCSFLNVKTPRIPFANIGGLLSVLNKVIERAKESPDEDAYPELDRMTDDIRRWNFEFSIPTTTNREFQIDLAQCLLANEAVLQRTIMTTVIDRWQLPDKFVFNCEGQWSIPEQDLLGSMQADEEIPLPKPDLAMFFNRKSLHQLDFAMIPTDLKNALSPDNTQSNRAFPFLFIEVKKAGRELNDANLANLNSASQALWNIYRWMSRANEADSFFESVRIYSIVFNARELRVRVHWARRYKDNKNLEYFFAEGPIFIPYTRDQALLLLRKILMEYANTKLHGILRRTFETVVKSRGQDPPARPPPKRAKTVPNESFGMSGLTTRS